MGDEEKKQPDEQAAKDAFYVPKEERGPAYPDRETEKLDYVPKLDDKEAQKRKLRESLRSPTLDMKLDTKDVIPDIRKDFGSGMEIGTTLEFQTVPRSKEKCELSKPWRVLLIPTNVKLPTLALSVRGDATVGRGAQSDVDLTLYGAEEKGVSRRHAMLRPGTSKLFLIDLKSTNGTQLNGTILGTGTAASLKNDDAILFGALHFTLSIVGRPEDEPYETAD